MDKEKRADNLSYDKKRTIADLDDKIYNNKKQINNLISIQDELISLDFNVNKCIDLLADNVKGEKNSILYDDVQQSGRKSFYSSLDIIEKNVDSLKRHVKDLMDQKEEELSKQDDSEEDN